MSQMMSNKSSSSIWWEEIQGPRSIKEEIFNSLSNGKSVILTGERIPWSKTLLYHISRDLEKIFNIYTEEKNGAENADNPEEFILKNFKKPNEGHTYRKGGGLSFTDYLKKVKVLENKLIYISGVSEKGYESWIKFLKEYKIDNAKKGIFLIEAGISLSQVNIVNTGRMSVIDVMSKISSYDILSFSMLLASKLDVNDIWKHYTAWVTSLAFEKNVESLANFIVEIVSQSEIKKFHSILKKEITDEKLFTKALWTTQIQILFPIIENLRIKIIEEYKNKLEDILSSETHEYYDTKITDPYDAELGFLFHLSKYNTLFPAKTKNTIRFLRDYRNNLAHLEYSDENEIDRIISLNSLFAERKTKN